MGPHRFIQATLHDRAVTFTGRRRLRLATPSLWSACRALWLCLAALLFILTAHNRRAQAQTEEQANPAQAGQTQTGQAEADAESAGDVEGEVETVDGEAGAPSTEPAQGETSATGEAGAAAAGDAAATSGNGSRSAILFGIIAALFLIVASLAGAPHRKERKLPPS